MKRPKFSEEWRIISSTSRFFPVHSKVWLKGKPPGSAHFDLEVEWEKPPNLLVLEDQDFPEVDPGTFRGCFGHPKEGRGEQFELVVTVCPGPQEKRFLCGFLAKNLGGTDPGPTGVWVAEEQPRKRPARRRTAGVKRSA